MISTALWKGVRLKDLLARAQKSPGAKYIAFRCYDGYDVGIPWGRVVGILCKLVQFVGYQK